MTVQEHAWFNEIVMLDWIEIVWKCEVAVSTHNIYYLLLDSCTIHMTAKVRTAFNECNTEVDFIPLGYTSKLQMLDDLGVNRPFRINMRKQFDTWFCNNPCIKPTRPVVATWIKNASNEITMPTILNSWMKSVEICSGNSNTAGTIPSVVDCGVKNDDPLQAPVEMDETDAYVSSQDTYAFVRNTCFRGILEIHVFSGIFIIL
jgi:DDE superfamily endonuclease